MENVETSLDPLDPKRSSSDINIETSSSDNFNVLEENTPNQNSVIKNKSSKYKFKKKSNVLVSFYITSFEKDLPPQVSLEKLKKVLPDVNLDSAVETEYGLVINLLEERFVNKIKKLDLGKIFGKPVQCVALFSGHYKKIVTFKDIPWCIRSEELEKCLKEQGISFDKITREESVVYIEVSDFPNFQRLREEGINFYNSVVFLSARDRELNEEIQYNTDNIIQCYRCQGFWHTANTCRQRVRCVRCGEEHAVDDCNRPRASAICCNCKGHHQASYKMCPVRMKLRKSIRVSFSFVQ